MQKNLSIIVPVYNEINAIEQSLTNLLSIKKNFPNVDIEILIIDDFSSDGTREILEKKSKELTDFKFIFNLENKGYGGAIKEGFKNSSHEFIGITDADETYPTEKLVEFLDIALDDNIDMVVGSRVGQNVNIPYLRRFPKLILNLLASYLVGKKIPDLNSGLRVMRKSLLKRYTYILPDGFSLTSTITLAAMTNGYRVLYKKIDYAHRKGSSKIRPISDTLNFLILIIRTVLLFRPLKVFVPLFFLLFIPGFVLFLLRVFIGEGYAISSMILLLASLQVLTVGMLADLVDRKFTNK